MPDSSETLQKAKAVWEPVRSFAGLWLALACLGGFVVLIGGPRVLAVLKGIFGPAAANPPWVITFVLLFALPLAIFFWIQGRRFDADQLTCFECGAKYPNTVSTCPKCGKAIPKNETAPTA
jgi:hypothetical protein